MSVMGGKVSDPVPVAGLRVKIVAAMGGGGGLAILLGWWLDRFPSEPAGMKEYSFIASRCASL